jgi:hypothetical protein
MSTKLFINILFFTIVAIFGFYWLSNLSLESSKNTLWSAVVDEPKSDVELAKSTKPTKLAKPAVEVEPSSRDLGIITYGDITYTTFALSNNTNDSLKITRLSTSCGCTKATIEKDQLKAGESTVIQVSFDPSVHDDDSDIGDIIRTIYIETDHPDYSDFETTITATVIKKD